MDLLSMLEYKSFFHQVYTSCSGVYHVFEYGHERLSSFHKEGGMGNRLLSQMAGNEQYVGYLKGTLPKRG